jgi:hypothetical protein
MFLHTLLIPLFSAALATSYADDSPKELSVPPLTEPEYPADRPEWIGESPNFEGRIHRWAICSTPSMTVEGAREDLLEQARATVAVYVREQMEDQLHGALDGLKMSEAWLVRNLFDEGHHYRGKVKLADAEFHEEAVDLVFMPEFRDDLRHRLREVELSLRMKNLSGLSVLAFASLATVSTVFRLCSRKKV